MKFVISKQFKLFVVPLIICIIGSKQAYGQLSLFYEDFGVSFTPVKCNDTIKFSKVKGYPNCILVIFLKDCNGKCSFELMDNKDILTITGTYDNAIDTLIKYQFSKFRGFSPQKKIYGISTIKYLYPLKKGVWSYYDKNHKTIKREEWDYLIN